jgi:hypothetical protein
MARLTRKATTTLTDHLGAQQHERLVERLAASVGPRARVRRLDDRPARHDRHDRHDRSFAPVHPTIIAVRLRACWRTSHEPGEVTPEGRDARIRPRLSVARRAGE